ncbi:hypothetical protein HOP50_17g79300 [Chloropicon primus]|uniref:DUF962 domain-containing protein n=1 Tax=Chloropicon primus TaxID=1764295 RepID=A0A5B8N0R1_9CHLO|nr:hypothetical protein A3770_17p79080 [Chloropicon primus]UPR04588.1 hypothetical protein HOP50_17g79300 [Chloropicon primus]|eukprot:QDZ25390.1 hypothetical protein A3770_17p79080 [Chloropicon primus]
MVAKGKGKGRHGDTFLGEKLAFYQSYHNNPWNKIIHVICIPLIVWAVLVWFCLVEVKVPVLDKEINLGMATTIAYSVMYTLADYSAGLTWVVFIGAPLYTVAMEAATAMEAKTASLWALAAFVFGFWVQIHAGHMVFEKRKPALMDGFAEAMLSAPLFVWLEIIFFFGFKKELQEEVEHKAAKLIASYEKQS